MFSSSGSTRRSDGYVVSCLVWIQSDSDLLSFCYISHCCNEMRCEPQGHIFTHSVCALPSLDTAHFCLSIFLLLLNLPFFSFLTPSPCLYVFALILVCGWQRLMRNPVFGSRSNCSKCFVYTSLWLLLRKACSKALIKYSVQKCSFFLKMHQEIMCLLYMASFHFYHPWMTIWKLKDQSTSYLTCQVAEVNSSESICCWVIGHRA